MEHRYCEKLGFSQIATMNKLRFKEEHTIVEKWPLALKLKKGDDGFDEEFETLFGSGNSGKEAYVE